MDTKKYKEHNPTYSTPSSKNNTKRLEYYTRLQAVLDANATRKQSLLMRKQVLDHQRKANYHNEYDRLRGDLSQHILRRAGDINVKYNKIRGDQRKGLEDRTKELEGLGVKWN